MKKNIFSKFLIFFALFFMIINISACTKVYTISFDTDGAEVIENILVKKGNLIPAPVEPTKEGYKFGGWYFQGEEWKTETDIVESDMNLIANWIANKYSIIFDTDGGNEIDEIKLDYDEIIVMPSNPTKVGYTFAGRDQEVPDKMPANDLQLKALWTINQYSITFDTKGGSEITAITQDYNTSVIAPNAPTKEGYEFVGWDKEVPETMPGENIVLNALWSINQYTITFDTDGGSEIGSITQDYNTAINTPSVPTKDGYVFVGWDQEIPTIMPAKNMTITALWAANKYSIIFDTDGGNIIPSIIQDCNTSISIPSNPSKVGYTFAGWDQEIPTIMPAKNMTIKALWVINQYTITFDTDGGNEISAITQDYNTEIIAPENPTKLGYTFAGWDQEVPNTMPANDLELKAIWTINAYTITFDTDGGNEISAITQDYNTEIIAPEDPTKLGYTFAGWDQEIPETMPSKYLELKAIWTINAYTITFDTDGGNEISAITQDYNTEIIAPENPTKLGYTFVGWDQEVPETMPANDLELKALWEVNQYTITFDLDGGEGIEELTFDYNEEIVISELPTKTGFVFMGWDKEIPETMPAENISVSAIWTANPKEVCLDTKTEEKLDSIIVADGQLIEQPKALTKEGYSFDAWYLGEEKWNFAEDVVTENITLVAKWIINQYKIVFDLDGGEGIEELTFDYNEEIVISEIPTKSGYTFGGWEQDVPELMPANDLELKALWEVNQYKIVFDLDGGEGTEELTFDYNEEIVISETPTKLGYTFAGWDKEVPETMPANDLELKALWEVNQYTITFDLDGGEGVEELTFAYNEEIVIPEKPSKLGYYFVGWDKEVPERMPAENITLKAIWGDSLITINYDNNGGYAIGYTDFIDINDIRTQLLNDYNAFSGGSHTLDTIGTLNIWGYTNFHTMLLANDKELLNKYMPLLVWISMNGSGSGTAEHNKTAFTKLLNGSTLGTDNDIYSISYELRAFMGSTVIRENTPFGTTNYTNDVFDSIWTYITEEYQSPKVTGIAIPPSPARAIPVKKMLIIEM